MPVQSSQFLYVARCTANNSRKRDEGGIRAPKKLYGPGFVTPPPPPTPGNIHRRKTMGGKKMKRLRATISVTLGAFLNRLWCVQSENASGGLHVWERSVGRCLSIVELS
jgi:hypothetical protein